MTQSFLQRKIMGLECQRLGECADAGLVSLSLPLPRKCCADDYSVNDVAAYVEGLGRWPDGAPDDHRRALIIADNDGMSPDHLCVSIRPDAIGDLTVPESAMHLMKRSPDRFFVWEQHALRINWGDSEVRIAMGLKTCGEIHWWEACRLVVLQRTPSCMVIEMGGAIPVDEYGVEFLQSHPGLKHPYLHKHNWINGHIYARLHANGVCEIFAHHINSKFSDDGAAFDDVVPVIGLHVDDQDPAASSLLGKWDGKTTEFKYGTAAFDMSEAAHLATPKQPGNIEAEDGLLVWQPYEGVELYGGICANTKTGDPYIFHSKDRHFPRGMSRTIRFRVSLNPERSPRIAHYLAPAWWYGACEEFWVGPYLPVSNEYDKLLHGYANCGKEYVHRGGFEDGNIPRGMSFLEGSDRPEPGWEGEAPYGLLLYAWRTGDADAYDTALRASWFFTDVIVDHAAKQVRMHGYPPNAFALPMARALAPIGAWLETGDPYLIDTARAVVDTAHWTEKNSWPRLAVGRDACYLRSAVMLHRYLGTDRYLEIAREGIGHVLASQREEGSFGDQGGGARIHQFSGYITKPWMAFMAIGGVLDYLELYPDDTDAIAGVRRMAEWLMRERYEHADGYTGWSYQHGYDGKAEFCNFVTGEPVKLNTLKNRIWHMEYMARFFMYCALEFKDADYFAAWHENSDARHGGGKIDGGDHSIAQALQYVPRLQAWLWRATVDEAGIHARPVWVGESTPKQATLLGPGGNVHVEWSGETAVSEDDSFSCKPQIL